MSRTAGAAKTRNAQKPFQKVGGGVRMPFIAYEGFVRSKGWKFRLDLFAEAAENRAASGSNTRMPLPVFIDIHDYMIA
ncbi:MAG: hypothetical protein KTR24_01740 [Saprospiraceae bacterium]|nr:hypothetical protein [Saprospiraceae bacterium]